MTTSPTPDKIKEMQDTESQTEGEQLTSSPLESSKNGNCTESQSTKVDNHLDKNDIVCFDPSAGMIFKCWLLYFESMCKDRQFDDVWKIRNIQNFLKGKALTLFINNSLNVLHWDELIDLFNEEFTTPGEIGLSDFSDIKFKHGENLMEYYQKKIQVARMLGLEPKLVLQGLTDGLPADLKQLVIVNAPKTTTEWRELVHRLEKIYLSDQTKVKAPVTNSQNVQEFRQWRPNKFSTNYYPNPRPNNYRFPQNNTLRFSNPSPMNYPPRVQRHINQSTGNNRVHFQESFPPSPCKICQQHRIMNAYHWHRNCPFKIANLTPPNASGSDQVNSMSQENAITQPNLTGDSNSGNC